MSHFIEGIGDEITWIFLIVVTIIVVYIAWKSTGISPTEYYVWLVRMRVNPNVNAVQILHMSDTDARVFEQRLAQRVRQIERATTASASVSQHASSEENINGSTSRLSSRSLPSDTSGISFTDNAHHWEVELVSASNSSQNSSLRSSDESLIDTLQRRVHDENSSVESQDGQSRRFILSRVPVRLDDNHDTDNELLFDADESTSSANDEQQEHGELTTALGTVLEDVLHMETPSPPSSSELFQDHDSAQIRSPTFNSGNFYSASSNSPLPSEENVIKLKFLDDTQIVATTSLDTTVGDFKRRYFYDPILAGKIVRLIYRGQLLRDDSRSLSSYGLHNECILHCNVSSVPYAQPSSNAISNSQPRLQRHLVQTYRGRSIEDNLADPFLSRVRNALIRWFRVSYNMVMGPEQSQNEERTDEVAAAAAAASRGFNDRVEAVSLGMLFGQHLHIFFAVKFALLWTFVYLYPQYTDTFSIVLLSFLTVFFGTVLFTSRRENRAEMRAP